MMQRNLYLIITLALFAGGIKAQIPDFTYEEIGETTSNMLCQESLTDVDNDGDLDIIIGSNIGTIWWFENTDSKNWQRRQLGDFALSDKGGITVDIDGDGFIDQVSGGTWFKNPGDKNAEWQRFENGAIYAYDMQAADLNNDGLPEIVAVSELEGTFIYFPGTKPEKKWKKIRIGDGVPGGIAPLGITDIDGDGDLDIIRTNIWFDNINGDASKWNEHKTLRFVQYQGKFALSSRVFAIDMDADGDMDIVQAESNNPNGSIAWHENKDGRGINWYLHPISTETEQDLHSLCVADFDNDGDLDIFSGGGPMSKDLYKRCFIWENTDGIGVAWEKKEILFKTECFDAMAGDLDGDGDIDIVGKSWNGKIVYLLRNNLK
jgi:hypothetical protein